LNSTIDVTAGSRKISRNCQTCMSGIISI